MKTSKAFLLPPLGLALALGTGCSVLIGLGDYREGTSNAGGGGNSGTPSACEPGSKTGCYPGPANTEGHGTCAAGKKTCLSDGSGYGDCVGPVLPLDADNCIDRLDTNCDGKLDCACTPGAVEDCYDGLKGTEVNSPCKPGKRTCNDQGTAAGECIGQVTPKPAEDCSTPVDDNCDGRVNENCTCTPAAVEDCYEGTTGTEGVGNCHHGQHTCNANGSAWGACIGQVTPKAEKCDVKGDEDCDNVACSEAVWGRLLSGMVGDSEGEANQPVSIVVDADGSTYFAGRLIGPSQLDPSYSFTTTSGTPFLMKLDATGKIAWARSLNIGMHLLIDKNDGNLLVAGGFSSALTIDGKTYAPVGQSDLFFGSFNSADGTLKWAKTYGSANVQFSVYSFAATASGYPSYLLGGAYSAPAATTISYRSFGATKGYDGFVVTMDSSGNLSSAVTIGDKTGATTAGYQAVTAVTGDSAGNILGGLWYNSSAKLGTSEYDTGVADYDAAVFKIRLAETAPYWNVRVHTPNNDRVRAMAVDNGGSVWAGGTGAGTMDLGGGSRGGATGSGAWLAHYSDEGVHQWSTVFDGAGADVETLAIDGNGDIVFAGYTTGKIDVGGGSMPSSLNEAVYLAKIANNGSYKWGKVLGGTGMQADPLLAIAPSTNRISLAIYNSGSVNLDSGTLTMPTGVIDTVVLASFQP